MLDTDFVVDLIHGYMRDQFLVIQIDHHTYQQVTPLCLVFVVKYPLSELLERIGICTVFAHIFSFRKADVVTMTASFHSSLSHSQPEETV